MATISIRVDNETRDQLESYARARGSSLSDLLRRAIDTVLERDPTRPWDRSDVPPTLSVLDRRILQLHHQTLALVASDPVEREESMRQAYVLERGYTLEYANEFGRLEPELSRADCLFVFDVLDMFRILDASFRKLAASGFVHAGTVSNYVRFRGFDVNDSYEHALAGYVHFLTLTDRWPEHREFVEETGGNSHMPMADRYRRMLSVYKPMRTRRVHGAGSSPSDMLLSSEEVRRVVDAAVGPE
ncbi:YfbU family protein [Aeromicrobium sp. Root472D3]|uniref:YfbU family protein n=1 Tax=Aeromicrobium sp. Root472D3 TaxID=1736540 RepID=UPI0009EC3845|nr:YfbU family protein [Aeromicrobium sp. Root472D3]